MKRKVGAAIATAVLAGAILAPGAAHANTSPCNNRLWSSSGLIQIFNINIPGPECELVQARMYRYYGGTVHTLLGPQSHVQSHVSSSTGTNAGNSTRIKAFGSSWTSWVNAPY